MNNIYQGWDIKTLGEVSKINPKNKLDDDLEVSFIPMNLIADKYQNKFSYTIRTWKEVKKGYTHLQNNCIVIAKITPCFENGKCVILQDLKNGYGAGTTELIVILPNENVILLKFIFYFFNTAKFTKEGVKNFKGTAGQLRVSSDFISNLSIPLPPLETQRKIVAKLESEFAKIESAKSHLEKVKETIPRLKNSLLKSAFNGELTRSYKDKKGAPYRHYEDSLETEAIYNAESPLKDSIAESKACNIVDCHELHCNSRKDKSVAQAPNFTQAPNLGGATLVAQNLQGDINSLGCHSEALAEESQNIKPHKDSTLKDISATPQYDKTTSFYHADFPSCHSDLECNEREESKRYFANAQYDETASFCHSEGDKPEESHIADSNRDISHFSNTQYDKENNLPQGWEIKTLRDILSSDKYAIKRGPFGSMLKKEFFVDSGIRVFEQYNPINQDSNWKRYFVTQQKFKELESFKAGAGDLLISCSGTLGKILELPKGVEVGIINQALLKIRLDDKQILNSYFVYLFNSPYMQKIILENTIGSAIQNIASVKTLKQIQIPIPPLEIQKQIVEILDSKFAALENLEKETNASLEKLQKLKSSLLNLAFKGELIC